ncbi:1-(5-phosphoribosyl)-5-[(5-phosphoribosylamino) methylideneamino] imidazole-4-carboxamide isomerase [Clostridia bacterium]|nr:1-(5-phosphoribosyl)-5-[(5-phosphoribosylamino) methylideneamino] imidazole-4-carboxamide isomerase [Clostridia bacterium]
MIIFPAIDLSHGQCVRLYQGDFNKKTIMNDKPLDQAKTFIQIGAQALHIVDLDGALSGNVRNFFAIQDIRNNIHVPIQVGGGVRSLAQINRYKEIGIDRVILGSKAVEDRYFLRKAYSIYGNLLAVSIDAKDDMVATRGWKNISEWNYLDFAKEIEDIGLPTIIYTDISRDGTLHGPNLEHLERLVSAVPSLKIIASGGVRSKEDLEDIKNLGVYGTIVGESLYQGLLTMQDIVSI